MWRSTRELPLLYVLVAAIIFTGCESFISPDFPDYAPELVVFCVFEPDSIWTAHIHRTVGIEGAAHRDTLAVTDAQVHIFAKDRVIAELLHVGGGIYVDSMHSPVDGELYTLRVSSPQYATVVAESEIPSPAPIPSLIVQQLPPSQNWGDRSDINLSFNDSPVNGEKYALRLFADLGAAIPQEVYFESRNQLLQQGFIVDLFGNRVRWADPIFSDDSFNGGRFEVDLRVPRHPVNEYIAEVLLLSEPYYRYLQSTYVVEQNEGNPFAEPAQPYTNIKGGRGLFGGFQRSRGAVHLNEISPGVMAGEYQARFLDLRIKGERVVFIPGDSQIELSIASSGRVEGTISLSAGFDPNKPDSSLQTALEGTFRYDGRFVTFDFSSRTFLDDVRWTYEYIHPSCGVVRTRSSNGDFAAVLQRQCI